MKAYRIALLVGYLGALVAGTFQYGCATSIGSVLVIVGFVVAYMFDGIIAACMGPERWHHKIATAEWKRSTLLLAGLTAGAVPICISYILIGPSIFAHTGSTRMALGLFTFFLGMPAASWITLFTLMKISSKETSTPRPSSQVISPKDRI